MTVKQPHWLGVALLVFLSLSYLLIDRVVFITTAETGQGTVSSVQAHNAMCGGRRNRYDCTRYRAVVRFSVEGSGHQITVAAGSVRGHDQPLTRARYRVGASVPVAYSPGNPLRAYRDEFWDIWAAPFLAFVFQIASLFGAFIEPKQGGNRPDDPIQLSLRQ